MSEKQSSFQVRVGLKIRLNLCRKTPISKANKSEKNDVENLGRFRRIAHDKLENIRHFDFVFSLVMLLSGLVTSGAI